MDRYTAYAKFCRDRGIEPATEERWAKLQDRNLAGPNSRSRIRGHKKIEKVDTAEFLTRPIGERLAWWERYKNGDVQQG
jgi:hypothetical protein